MVYLELGTDVCLHPEHDWFRVGSVAWMTASSIVGWHSRQYLHQSTAMSWCWVKPGNGSRCDWCRVMLRQYQAGRALVANGSHELPTLLNRQTILTYCLPLACHGVYVATKYGLSVLGRRCLGCG